MGWDLNSLAVFDDTQKSPGCLFICVIVISVERIERIPMPTSQGRTITGETFGGCFAIKPTRSLFQANIVKAWQRLSFFQMKNGIATMYSYPHISLLQFLTLP